MWCDYVVAQLGLNNLNYYAFDYMLETIFFGYYLLFIFIYYLLCSKTDANRNYNLLHIYSENNNKPVIFNNIKYTNIQSAENWALPGFPPASPWGGGERAENCKGFSETIRQISKYNYHTCFSTLLPSSRGISYKSGDSFINWLAGVIDGDGNFYIHKLNCKLVLKAIRIKLHNRDVRILT